MKRSDCPPDYLIDQIARHAACVGEDAADQHTRGECTTAAKERD